MEIYIRRLNPILYGFLITLIFATNAYSWNGNLTFETFYSTSLVNWWTIGIGIVATIGAIVAIYLSGGAASPLIPSAVLKIGAWIGSTAGHSGIAAINYGLATIGGGSMAAGGLGMLGGVVILTSALTFTTEVAIDYTMSKAIEVYKQTEFLATARYLPVLPLPLNDHGSDLYEQVVDLLKNQYNNNLPNFSDHNQNVINACIKIAHNYQSLTTSEELGQIYTLLSLLYLNEGNYDNAYYYANHALLVVQKINAGKDKKYLASLPHSLLAITSLSQKDVDVEWSLDHLEYAIGIESSNPLIPFVISAYIDRLMLRLDKMKYSHFQRIQKITLTKESNISKKVNQVLRVLPPFIETLDWSLVLPIRDHRISAQVNQILLVKSIVMVKKEQDFISIVTSTGARAEQCDAAKRLLITSVGAHEGYLSVAESCLHALKIDDKFLRDTENKSQLFDLARTIGQYEVYRTVLGDKVNNYKCNYPEQTGVL